MRFGAELRGPLYVPAGFGIKGIGQMLLLRHHVARPSLSPLRLVCGGRVEVPNSDNQVVTKQPDPSSKPPVQAAAGKIEQDTQATNTSAFHWGQVDREPEQASINKKSLRRSRTPVV